MRDRADPVPCKRGLIRTIALKLDPNYSFLAADGVLREVWMNKGPPEFTLANVFDGYASHLEVVANFSLSYNDGPFAERLRAFLRAGESGGFEFQLSCTYQCELWISPNDEAGDKGKIASHYGTGNADGSERYVKKILSLDS